MISAIMPTGDRRELAELALDCFLAQDIPEQAELLVLDDGKESMEGLFRGRSNVLYFRHGEGRLPLGDKRNFLVKAALGEIVIHWDDDDWSAPDRMRRQAQRLRETGKSVTGFNRIFYWDTVARQAYRYAYAGAGPYAPGTSQCYTRKWGLDHPFPPKSYAEDTDFSRVAASAGQLDAVDAGPLMVVRTHPKNTGHPQLGSRHFPAVRVRELPPAFFDAIMGPESHADVCTTGRMA